MKQWYVIHSKPQKERFLCNQFELQKIEVYCPLIKTQLPKKDYIAYKPFFPGYLFIHVDLELIGLSILQWTPGVVNIVNFDGEPAFVPDSQIFRIQQRIEKMNGLKIEQQLSMKPGDVVVIEDGPFTGWEAIFESNLSGSERVRVLLNYLQGRQYRLELPYRQTRLKNQC
jgi:transcriptional antiterminator RfaH